eukprot:gene6726-13625_t
MAATNKPSSICCSVVKGPFHCFITRKKSSNDISLEDIRARSFLVQMVAVGTESVDRLTLVNVSFHGLEMIVHKVRLCRFSHAHVDTPKGDLDFSMGELSLHPVANLSQIYRFGTAELFPIMQDSKGNVLTETAHDYTECSNKGICNRDNGICVCFDGYDGLACQRLSCPMMQDNVLCSGHGTCHSAAELAHLDNMNIYRLWDKDAYMGCVCDPGYHGPDCSLRRCKLGTDPLYIDNDFVTPRTSNFTFVLWTLSATANITGQYSIVFYDVYGEDWVTAPIQYGAPCVDIIQSLESLPVGVIPSHSVRCLQWSNYQSVTEYDEPVFLMPNPYFGIKFTLVFPENPGKLKQPEIQVFLDGSRPTLEAWDNDHDNDQSSEKNTVNWFIYANGFHGDEGGTEDVADLCRGVTVTLTAGSFYDELSGLSMFEERLLKRCLGDADGDPRVSSEESSVTGHNYDWDYGSVFYPHLVKLVDASAIHVSDLCNVADRHSSNMSSERGSASLCKYSTSSPGFYAVVIFDPTSAVFRVLSRVAADYSSTTSFVIFTTTGTLAMVSPHSRIVTGSRPYSQLVTSSNTTDKFPGYKGNIDCETNPPNVHGARYCLEYGDRLMIFDPSFSAAAHAANPKYLNLFRVLKIWEKNHIPHIMLDMGINANYGRTDKTRALAYVFRGGSDMGYGYASECAGRGSCDVISGECICHTGFTGVDCSIRDVAFSQ